MPFYPVFSCLPSNVAPAQKAQAETLFRRFGRERREYAEFHSSSFQDYKSIHIDSSCAGRRKVTHRDLVGAGRRPLRLKDRDGRLDHGRIQRQRCHDLTVNEDLELPPGCPSGSMEGDGAACERERGRVPPRARVPRVST